MSEGAGGTQGWYVDPWSPVQLRWWDGGAWSGAVRPLPPRPPAPVDRLPAGAWPRAVLVTVVLLVGTRVVLDRAAAALRTPVERHALAVVFYVVVYGVLAFTVVRLTRRYGTGDVRRDLGLRFRWSDLGFGIVLFIGARIAQAAVTLPILLRSPTVRRSTEHYSRLMRHQSAFGLFLLAFVGILVAPLVEELLFRGLIQRSMSSQMAPPVACVAQGVLFGLYHFAPQLGWYNAVLLVGNGTFGIVFGFVALRRRTLGTGIVAHALTNGSVVALILLSR